MRMSEIELTGSDAQMNVVLKIRKHQSRSHSVCPTTVKKPISGKNRRQD